MKKYKNNFAQKFHLLSSQESHDINWSCSDSSDFENVSCNIEKLKYPKKANRKRKRKQTIHKNLSNLDITVVDVVKETKTSVKPKSPDLIKFGVEYSDQESARSKSPILGRTQYISSYNCNDEPKSPIITCKTELHSQAKVDRLLKSPILILKSVSPKISPNVKKKLFKKDIVTGNLYKTNESFILNETFTLDRRKSDKCSSANDIFSECIKIENQASLTSTADNNRKSKTKKSFKDHNSGNKFIQLGIDVLEPKSSQDSDICVINETPELKHDDSMAMLKTPSADLAAKVKKYFDSRFSSENASQQTISDISTSQNNSKTSDDVEITNTLTQFVSNKNSTESVKLEEDNIKIEKKKIRYKKDGLSYRLNNLLKKQMASISLWHHERFLAVNSNFVIPKEEFRPFRICKISFKYGCHLLETMDLNDDIYLILINSCYMTSYSIAHGSILKLYEPYKILDYNVTSKLIISVIKFEIVNIKT